MTTQTIKLTKPVDFLPKNLQKEWAGADVFMVSSEDMITIKRIQEPEFWSTWEKLKFLGKSITQKEIDEAVQEVRSEKL